MWLKDRIYNLLYRASFNTAWRKLRGRTLKDDGVCVAVDLGRLNSLSQLGRDFIDKLQRTKVSFEYVNLATPLDHGLVLPMAEVRRYSPSMRINYRDVMTFRMASFPKDRRYRNAGTLFWEFESGIEEGLPGLFDGVDCVVAFSDFCADYFRSLPLLKGRRICKIRYPFARSSEPLEERCAVRRRIGVGENDFVVFFHFNLASSSERKNPRGALRAFFKAFPDRHDARLVIKVAGADLVPDAERALKQEISDAGFEDRVVLLSGNYPHAAVMSLIAAADVYMSLHRGEGFGIGMLEAMSVGTPVVCTNYGGNTDFCKPETAFLVGYRMVKPECPDGYYRFVKEWPDPDVEEAAGHLRTIYSDRNLARKKAACATRFIDEYFSDANFEADVRAYLRETVV